MSKKSRKARAKVRTGQQTLNKEEVEHSDTITMRTAPRRVKAVPDSISPALPLTTRYQHIVPELIRIAIISGAIFVITIILSFVIK